MKELTTEHLLAAALIMLDQARDDGALWLINNPSLEKIREHVRSFDLQWPAPKAGYEEDRDILAALIARSL